MNKTKHINIGDKVKVIAGNQKGTIGNIITINIKKQIATIDTINPRIKYVKARQGEETKQVELQIPIHISNVMLWDTAANKASRIGYKIINNKKSRYFKRTGNLV